MTVDLLCLCSDNTTTTQTNSALDTITDQKTVEPHLIAPASDPRRHASSCGETVLQDFYDQSVRLSVVGYLRPELPFEGLEKLVVAIKNDIATAEKLGSATATDSHALQECDWVKSDAVLVV